MKLLLVEDNEMNRDLLTRRLERRGFELEVALDGRDAVAKVRNAPPDLILMDMSLPAMDGWEATRVLKADESTRSVPVIALTAHAMEADRRRALEAGCDEFETKPVDLTRLIEKIRRFEAEPS